MGQPLADSDTTTAKIAGLDRRARELIEAALDPKSRSYYDRIWKQFEQFCIKFHFPASLPISETTLLRFISFLFDKGYAASTICSAMSALAYFHFGQGLSDPRSRNVQQALVGLKNLLPSSKGCDPLPLEVLNGVLDRALDVFPSAFTGILFQAMAVLAFYALLRVGEFTYSRHTLRREDISWSRSCITIKFQSFKHSGGVGTIQTIPAITKGGFCPVQLLGKYLELRGDKKGYLFVKEDGKAPSRKEFLAWMREVLSCCKTDAGNYNTHSFRAGMATHMALRGYSTEQIKLAGRWASDAYKKYIRVAKF